MSYPLNIEDHVSLVQQTSELMGREATPEDLELFRLLFTLINKSYDFGHKGEKAGFLGVFIENAACSISTSKELREMLVVFIAEAVNAYLCGVQESMAQ